MSDDVVKESGALNVVSVSSELHSAVVAGAYPTRAINIVLVT